jgi:hypothetical protein
VVLLCRDQLKIATDKTMSAPQTRAETALPANTQIPNSPRQKTEKNPEMLSKDDLQISTEAENELAEPALADEDIKLDDSLLIFSEDNLKQLQRRTEELKTERTMQKNKFK